MPRRARIAPGGLVYHALNRAVARLPLFQKAGDFAAFFQVMHEAMERHPTRLLAFCLMPNHWHMVLWPRADAELTAFLRWLTHTHTMRWHVHYHSSGTGHRLPLRPFFSAATRMPPSLRNRCIRVHQNSRHQ